MTKLNPQVLKFAEQAKGFVYLNQLVGGDNGCMIYTYEGLNKFAELIVRECCDLIYDRGEHSDGSVTKYKILKHFGLVE